MYVFQSQILREMITNHDSTYIKIESAVDPSIIQMRHFLASPHYHRINKNVLAWIVHESFKSTRWSQNTELGKHSQLTAE